MRERSSLLATNLEGLASEQRRGTRSRSSAAHRTLQLFVGDLVAARAAAGLTQEQVAARMRTRKSAVSRLESGSRTLPTLRTVESYALAVGAQIEIRVRARR